jgi:hypothetical protein
MKKNITYFILTILSLALFTRCKERRNITSIKYQIDITDAREKLIDTSIISTIQYIPLKSDFLIGSVDKLIFSNSMYYLLDKRFTNSISIFNSKGELISIINNRGKGPEEYTSILDFYVDSNGNVNIHDNSQNKIITYSIAGKFIKSTGITLGAFSSSNIGENKLCTYRTIKNGKLHSILSLYNLNNHKVETLIPCRNNIDKIDLPILTKNHLYKSGESLFFNNYFSNIIYKVEKEDLIPYCKLIMQDISPEEQVDYSSNNQKMMKDNIKIPLLIRDIFETQDYLTFSFIENGLIDVFYSKKTGKCLFLNNFRDKRFYGMIPVQGISDNNFITYMNPSNFYKNNEFWDTLCNNDKIEFEDKNYLQLKKSDANIVLIVYSLKKF